MNQRPQPALVRRRAALAANPSALCWLRACPFYRQQAALAAWFGRPGLTHRLYHALASAPCANMHRPPA